MGEVESTEVSDPLAVKDGTRTTIALRSGAGDDGLCDTYTKVMLKSFSGQRDRSSGVSYST